MIRVCGDRLLIEAEIEKVSKGGIILSESELLMKAKTEVGTILQVGEDAWKTMYVNKYQCKPWAKVGDRVIFARHGGKYIYNPDDNKQYLIINCEDIYCVIDKKKK